MIINGPDRHGETFEADICVVGAGAAGLTLATDLARRGVAVVLVESGGLQFQERSHKLLDVELTGRGVKKHFLDARERFFGGTTNHWGGICRTLDEIDFEPHSWMPHSGWPFKYADLASYYTAAARLLGLSEVERLYDANSLGVADRPRLVNESNANFKPIILRPLPAEHLRMGKWLLEEVEKSELLQCVLNTTIAEIHPDASRERVASLEGRTFERGTLHFRAKDYVLCASTIENARLLLVSDSVVKGGLGNAHDLVGRYYMGHPGGVIGTLLLTGTKTDYSQEEFLTESFAGQKFAGWAISPAVRENRQLQGFGCFVVPGYSSLPLPYERAIGSLLRRAADPAPNLSLPRKSPLFALWEQSPNLHSRVTLSSERDELGVRKPRLQWDLTDGDLSSARESIKMLSLAVTQSKLGRLHQMDITWEKGAFSSGHHMGTTRMSNDPRHGVTDSNGRVHSLENLFIGGASLFPTGGWQHPTFTIIALALRQADLLKSREG